MGMKPRIQEREELVTVSFLERQIRALQKENDALRRVVRDDVLRKYECVFLTKDEWRQVYHRLTSNHSVPFHQVSKLAEAIQKATD